MFFSHGRRGCGPRGYYAIWGHAGRGGGYAVGYGRGVRGGGDGGGRRRMFDSGELRLILLKLIEETARHGYDLIRDIEERTGGAYAPSPGVIYPTLTLLDDMALIAEEKTEGARRLFAITEAGRAHLAERAGEVEALFSRINALGAMRTGSDSVPVRRAMGNLRAVLQNRMDGEIGSETLHDIADLIDEAARKIERL